MKMQSLKPRLNLLLLCPAFCLICAPAFAQTKVTVADSLYSPTGGAGVKDIVAVCAKDATDAYGWRAIY